MVAGGSIAAGRACRIVCSNVFIENGSSLIIGDNVVIDHCELYIKGSVTIGDNTILKGGSYILEPGELEVGHHCKSTAKRLWVRFGGRLTIGDYTNINDDSEIRCDQEVTIGRYNQISYNVRIWDTNTHNVYPAQERRIIAETYWPYFGKETRRPVTKPVSVGDDCWIGENAAILKGSTLGNEVVVGYGTLICGQTVEAGKMVVSRQELRII